MCGMHADGSKADGFKSMVVAQYTGIGLEKDNVLLLSITAQLEHGMIAVLLVMRQSARTQEQSTNLPTENFHIKVSNKAELHSGSFDLCDWIC